MKGTGFLSCQWVAVIAKRLLGAGEIELLSWEPEAPGTGRPEVCPTPKAQSRAIHWRGVVPQAPPGMSDA